MVFFFQAEDGIQAHCVTGVQTCALPISPDRPPRRNRSRRYRSCRDWHRARLRHTRSEEHTSELQSHSDLVCRLLLEKKKRTCCTASWIYDMAIVLEISYPILQTVNVKIR